MSGKCDELKDKCFNAYPEIMGIEGDEPTQCYGKADVDAAIDELKTEHHKERHEYIEMVAQLRRENAELKMQANGFKNRANLWEYNAQNEHNAAVAVRIENAKLKKKLEDAKATAYAESVDAGMRERRLRRALWISRADRAIMTLEYFTLKCRWFKDYMKVEPPGCDVKMIHKWAAVERKCRAKAEEYK